MLTGKKIRVPRWCWIRSSRPVARVRPLLDLLRSFPCGVPRAIFARAPGLPPTGKTYPTPRNSILPSTGFLVLLDQRFAIDPCSPSLNHFAMLRVTQLEPRTLHQPEKLKKLSKNDYVFTPSIFAVNEKIVLLCGFLFNRVQPVHRRVTGFGAAAAAHHSRAGRRPCAIFIIRMRFSAARFDHSLQRESRSCIVPLHDSACEYRAKAAPDKVFGIRRFPRRMHFDGTQEHESSSDNVLTMLLTLLKCQKSLLKSDSRAKVPGI